LELIAACDDSYYICEQIEWRENREETRKNFKSFVEGSVSYFLHSPRMYEYLYWIFFGGDRVASTVLANVDLNDDQKAQLMRGLIKKGKQGIFPWVFEDCMSS
jgi:hypothetical protein